MKSSSLSILILPVLLTVATIAQDAEQEPSQLIYELSLRHYDTALGLMASEQDIDAVDPRSGYTALLIAAQDESADAYDMVKALVVQYGADPAITSRRGLTPLHYAAIAGNLAVVELLVNNQADIDAHPEIPGCDEKCPKITPLYVALARGRTRVGEWLEKNGAELPSDETRENLDLQAKMLDALKAMDDPAPPNVDEAEWKKISFNRQAERIALLLESEGMVQEAGQWRQMMPAMRRVIDDSPWDGEVPIETYLQNAIQAVLSQQNTPEED